MALLYKFAKFRRLRNTQSSDWHALVGRVHKPGTFRFCFVDKIPVLLQVKRISSLPSKVSLSTSHTHCISLCVAQWNQIISEEEFSFPFFHTFHRILMDHYFLIRYLKKLKNYMKKDMNATSEIVWAHCDLYFVGHWLGLTNSVRCVLPFFFNYTVSDFWNVYEVFRILCIISKTQNLWNNFCEVAGS